MAWQQRHGRNDLPWQNTRDPYRVWLSEIMLQQTQVATVKAYFARFIARFSNVAALAQATQDEVLGLWSGLGYYSRARNLHRCAQEVMQHHGGVFPRDAATLATLPGIGRSTAAAISSLCFGERVAILDANVKRVVTRVSAFDADLAQAKNEKLLWSVAAGLLPEPADSDEPMRRYTQGMMDVGALVCTPRAPRCGECPVQMLCQAQRTGQQERLPVRSRTLKRSSQSLWLLWLSRDDPQQATDKRGGAQGNPQGQVWLAKRPTPGVWAGLYCLPLFDSEAALLASLPSTLLPGITALPPFPHVLTHKDLHLHPLRVDCSVLQGWEVNFPPDATPKRSQDGDLAGAAGRWFDADQWPALGLPAPIRKLLETA